MERASEAGGYGLLLALAEMEAGAHPPCDCLTVPRAGSPLLFGKGSVCAESLTAERADLLGSWGHLAFFPYPSFPIRLPNTASLPGSPFHCRTNL